MEFLLVIGLIIFIYIVMPKGDTIKAAMNEKFVIEKKKCPPHQWFWQEIVDQSGEKQGERIVCKVCGPLSKSLNGDQE